MSNKPEPSWKSIASRKQAAHDRACHEPSSISIAVPHHLLPHDPPSPKDGPQPVHHIPDELLSAQDRTITSLSIPDLLAAIRNRTYTSVVVTSAFIRRASLAHQLTNCLTEPLFTRALARATILDRDFHNGNGSGRGKLQGPLHGLPVSIKDGFNVAGYDSSIGLASLCFQPATSNAPLVDLLESLGCIIIAKTNIPQTLASLDSVNNVFGRTYNPFNRLLTAGGSSGGEGVLVAMRGSAIGFGTDIGGSIRVPAMCNGVYGFKPSVGRIPYGGQRLTGLDGMSRSSVQAVAGPIARSMEDIECVMREIVPVASLFGEDCISWSKDWMAVPLAQDPGTARQRFRGAGPNGEFVVGVLRSDGNCQLLPPVAKLMDEVGRALRRAGSKMNVKVVDLATPKAWTKAQSVMSKLMGVDGGAEMSRMLLESQEPLVPWMSTRFKHGGKAQKLERVVEIQAQRSQLETEMLQDVWKVSTDEFGRKARGVDAVICPLAPHPVPEIERYNAVGYTSSWVLFDYPAGSVPVREVRESDLELGKPLDTSLNVLGSWDEKNRELWDESKTDRKVYLKSMLSVQCVTGRLEDEKLAYVMALVDEAVKGIASGREAKL